MNATAIASNSSLVTEQPSLFQEGADEGRAEELKGLLAGHDWLTRKGIMAALGWTERDVRHAAEAAGAAIVRGPRGFALFEKAPGDDIAHCANIADAQGDKMKLYAAALRRRLHQRIGA